MPLPASDPVFCWRPTLDAVRLHAIHSEVIARTPDGMVRLDSLEFFQQHVQARGVILGCFLDDEQMIAYGVLSMHAPVVDHLAAILDADRSRFCVLDGASAQPTWRGQSLHQAAIEQRFLHASALGRTLIGATVAPHNLRALRSLFHAKLEVHAYGLMYGGMVRLIVKRDLALPVPDWRRVCQVDVSDHAGLQAALADGLVGHACSQHAKGSWQIDFGKTI